MISKSHLFACFLISGSLVSCGRQQPCGGCLESVFNVFRFVGDFPVSLNPAIAKQNLARPFPQVFQKGRIYVFQTIEPISTEEVAINMLPSRIRKCSGKVIDAPHSVGDFGVASLGGPFWSIRFQIGSCIGHITNRYNADLDATRVGWPPGSRDDYLLKIDVDDKSP